MSTCGRVICVYRVAISEVKTLPSRFKASLDAIQWRPMRRLSGARQSLVLCPALGRYEVPVAALSTPEMFTYVGCVLSFSILAQGEARSSSQ